MPVLLSQVNTQAFLGRLANVYLFFQETLQGTISLSGTENNYPERLALVTTSQSGDEKMLPKTNNIFCLKNPTTDSQQWTLNGDDGGTSKPKCDDDDDDDDDDDGNDERIMIVMVMTPISICTCSKVSVMSSFLSTTGQNLFLAAEARLAGLQASAWTFGFLQVLVERPLLSCKDIYRKRQEMNS
ncbi:NEUZ containing protein [Cricetulus griseus]|nr:NEUZ containing protein [Cricetulus griseus]